MFSNEWTGSEQQRRRILSNLVEQQRSAARDVADILFGFDLKRALPAQLDLYGPDSACAPLALGIELLYRCDYLLGEEACTNLRDLMTQFYVERQVNHLLMALLDIANDSGHDPDTKDAHQVCPNPE